MKYIRLKTKEQFKEIVSGKWKKETWLWNTYKEDTCYVTEGEYFISLSRAKELGYLETL